MRYFVKSFLSIGISAVLLGQIPPESRLNQHRVSSQRSPAPEPGAEKELISSLVEGLNTPDDWYRRRRPEILKLWMTILGKIEPAAADKKWFPDIRRPRILDKQDRGEYTRVQLELRMETDFWQPHLLLIPKNKGSGPFPAVIAWTSSTPDYMMPEEWWGAWLASRGYVVLTGWSFIRNYRDGTTARTGAHEKVYERFGRWMALGKMVHDAEREAEYLTSLRDVRVDHKRIGFIGFSLGAKAAVYVAAFSKRIGPVVALDPHIAVNGGTNWYAPWYLDWTRPFHDIFTKEQTVLSLLNPDPARPGFEHDHHELLALAAPKPFLLIGGSQSEDRGGDSDDLQSWGYFNRAREVYRLLGIEDRIQFASTADGHKANGPNIDPAWQQFFERWLRTAISGARSWQER
jgi:dienelactone hydrolase